MANARVNKNGPALLRNNKPNSWTKIGNNFKQNGALTLMRNGVLVDSVQHLTNPQSILDLLKLVVFLVYRINMWVL
jgi:hypothetical protein